MAETAIFLRKWWYWPRFLL